MKKEKDYRREMGLRLVMEGCKQLGWEMAIPDVADDEEVPGVVCGTKKWMKNFTEDAPVDDEIEIEIETA